MDRRNIEPCGIRVLIRSDEDESGIRFPIYFIREDGLLMTADLNPLGVQNNNLKTAPDAGGGPPLLPLSIRLTGHVLMFGSVGRTYSTVTPQPL